MANQSALAVILAAGEGTRMRSPRPKVMHEVGGMPMLGHVLAAAAAAGIERRAVVVGAQATDLRTYLGAVAGDAAIHRQRQLLGTAHAVLSARSSIAAGADQVLILYGDTPLITSRTLRRIRRRLAGGADLVVLGFRPADPARYGRLIVEGRRLIAIREAAEASADEKRIGLCNAGIMGFSGADLLAIVKQIGNANAKHEYYLTDAVEIANRLAKRIVAMEVDADEVLGVNSRHDLALAESAFQLRARNAAMAAGATMIAPETVWLSHDTRLGRDVTIEPNVFFGPGVRVGDGVEIRAHSHIVGATIGSNAIVGPFARLRPGARVGRGAKVGNFVEVKNADIGVGAKVNHLAYVGDTSVGEAANIGAGVITCNYDGFAKHRTEIGAGAFIGSNSSLIAPLTIGDGAYIATGSVITRDVAPGTLSLARTRQVDKPGWARKFRDRNGKSAANPIERKSR